MTYQVKLQDFEGPLDLLLHLIRKNELDIYAIRVSDIANQYLEYVQVMQQLNLDGVGDFLVMAATLAYHKSRMLLPVPEDGQDTEEEDGVESLEDLHRRLLEYQRFKEAAFQLQDRGLLNRDVFHVRLGEEASATPAGEDAPLKATLFDLLDAFQRVLKRAPAETVHEVLPDRIRVADRMMEMLDLLSARKSMLFEDFFERAPSRQEIVATFLALLELVRMRVIQAFQAEPFGPIHLKLLVEEDSEAREKLKEGMGSDEYE